MVKEIDENIRLEIYSLVKQAKELITSSSHAQAEQLCDHAWSLLPTPKAGWDVSYVVLRSIILRLRDIGNHEKAILLANEFLKEESIFKTQAGPIFLLGAAYYDNNELDLAYDYLTKANTLSKGRCFVEEPPKYKEFLKIKRK